jgi:hypothetical protein
MNELIPIEKVNAVELYTDKNALQKLLDNIKKQATNFTPDISTPQGRAEITSQAYKVTQSKGIIEAALKAETDEWTRKKKIVDACRKTSRDFCDNLRDKIKEPLEAWKEEDARKTAELARIATEKAEAEAAELEAYAEDDLWERERQVREAARKVRETEMRLEAEEAERKRIRAVEEAKEERKKEETRIRLEAEETARREAQAAIDKAEEKVQQAEKERVQAEAERKAEAEQAEQKRLEDIETERKRGIAEAERIERERLRLIEDEKRAAQARAADRENRGKINTSIVNALVAGGVGARTAKKVVTLVAGGKIPSISIRY